MNVFLIWLFVLATSLTALGWARHFHRQMMLADEGTDEMRSIAQSVRDAAGAYLNQQNKWVAIVFLVVAILLAAAASTSRVVSPLLPIAFLMGGAMSGLCGWFGMKTATAASGRTAAAARTSLNDALQIAFRSGAVMGLVVVGMGLLFIATWFAILYWLIPSIRNVPVDLNQMTVTMLTFGMGMSAQALFARVGGGIFTKAADVGADLVGKVEQSLAEDSPRNPATIADNVGDNVGDVAGMGADLFESYCGSILAAAALGVAAYSTTSQSVTAAMLPMTISALGILVSIGCIYLVQAGDDANPKSLLVALNRGISFASFLVAGLSLIATWALIPLEGSTIYFGWLPSIGGSVIIGLIAGLGIGHWTERATSDEYPATRRLAAQAETGPATIIIGGVADGMLSTMGPVIIICVAMFLAFGLANGFQFDDPQSFSMGLYGVGIAAVGMLSTLGITLATDAYGPIADNAGGNAEMAGLEPLVRHRTDALDSLGNTTAATGKGFAIGSAALTALALLAAYVESVRDGYVQMAPSIAAAQAEDPNAFKHVRITENEDGRLLTSLIICDQTTPSTQLNQASSDATSLDASQPNVSDNDSAVTQRAILATVSSPRREVAIADATLKDFLLIYDATLINPRVLIGLLLGAMSAFVFCALTMKSVGRAAQGMVVEVRRQFVENPGILDGSVTPDYQTPVEISTRSAQREMILPALLGLCLPVAVGLLLGVAGVLGLLAGSLSAGTCLAVFMANSGGSWDNAKKFIEADHHGGKGSDAHKASVVG
ncbi:MAG: sodium/proton-translocating pyrophosphatase, partial [Planctomycetota bacterium]